MPGVCFILFNMLILVNARGIENVTSLLDGLLLSPNYDRRIRPDYGGLPTKVQVNMDIKSLGPVSEDASMYSMDVYFRQSWYDTRLKFFLPGITELSMSWLFLEKIWKPDTYFLNGKKSHLHRITAPNKFVRMRNDGHLTYSMRLTISATCKMHLKKFPLDSQICPLIIGSYGYTARDVTYMWDNRGVSVEPGVNMAQYDIINITTKGNLFALKGKGYYVLQIYVPCTLIVCCSWISFWITPSDVAAVTTVLSITTLGFGGRSQLPKVSHATALDWFVIICFAFAFAVMIEYAVINFTDKLAKDIKKLLEEKLAKKKTEEKIEIEDEEIKIERPHYIFQPHRWYSLPCDLSKEISDPFEVVESPTTSMKSSLFWFRKKINAVTNYWKSFHFLPQNMSLEAEHKFHKIDIVARRAFPLAFITMISTYCLLYNYYINDRDEEEEIEDVVIGVVKVE